MEEDKAAVSEYHVMYSAHTIIYLLLLDEPRNGPTRSVPTFSKRVLGGVIGYR